MMRERSRLPALFAAAALAFAPGASAQTLRIGGEFQVNTYTIDEQNRSAIAAAPNGAFVVSWRSFGQDGDNLGIFARRFSSTGTPLASELQVNSYTPGLQRGPSVAVAADGDFVVVWQSNHDGSAGGVFAQRFSSAGVTIGSDFQVNTYTPNNQYYASVAAEDNGDFVVGWSSQGGQDGDGSGEFGQRFTSAGTPLATEFQISAYTISDQEILSVAADVDGDFVVAWEDQGARDGSGFGVFARRFSSSGDAVGDDFQVNVFTTFEQRLPRLAIEPDGDFVVAWMSGPFQDGSSYGIFARRYSSDGVATTGEFQVNTVTSSVQFVPSVAVQPNGDFLVTFTSRIGLDDQVFGRRYSSSGAAVGGELAINSFTSANHGFPYVAADDHGRYVVVWSSDGQEGPDFGVFGQRLATEILLDIDGNGSADALTDGLLLLRYLFGFRGAILVNGAVDLAGCTRCDAPAVEARIAEISVLELEEPLRLGTEFQVNTYTPSQQTYPGVSIGAGGAFVVAWASFYQDGDFGDGVFARRFAGDGAPLASEFQVNVYTLSGQQYPAAASDLSGGFVIAWQSFQNTTTGIYGRGFSSNGAPSTDELLLDDAGIGNQRNPSLARAGGGGFVVAWSDENDRDGSSSGIFARRLASTGTPIGGAFQVNAYTEGSQARPAVAAQANGDFVIAWQGAFDGSGPGIFARRFSSAGNPLANELQVNTLTEGSQYRPAIAADGDGDFLVVWDSFGGDGSGYGLFAQLFASDGTPLASELQVNVYTPGNQHRASVAASEAGDFIVAWQSYGQDGSAGSVFARRFASDGSIVGDELQVNTYTPDDQRTTNVRMDAQGRFVVAWNSENQDGSQYGVFAQRFALALVTLDVDGDGAITPLVDGLLVLRYLFGFRGAALTTGAVGPACTRCDAPSIETYVTTLL